ncbi:hypothetical protein EIP91_006892 [Steccherinum ochraceum]|uniref:NACHT domain-containing protein n=1 Tax=Steccherinum ochraceum TaxID=92696 RepID=A0A4R0RDC8_9APHY|nr:hypothetical protein EIP91_006892 [Steccherinum ochraceum]
MSPPRKTSSKNSSWKTVLGFPIRRRRLPSPTSDHPNHPVPSSSLSDNNSASNAPITTANSNEPVESTSTSADVLPHSLPTPSAPWVTDQPPPGPSAPVLPQELHPADTTTGIASQSRTQVVNEPAPQPVTAAPGVPPRPPTIASPIPARSSDLAWQTASDALKSFTKFAKVTGKAVVTALPIVAAGVDHIPIAKGVVGGLIAVISIVKTWQDNTEKVQKTIERLQNLQAELQEWEQRVQDRWAKHGLRLVKILEQLVEMKDQSKIVAFLSSKDDQGKILEFAKAVDQVLDDFDRDLQIQIFKSTGKTEEMLIDEESRTQLQRLKHTADGAYGKGRQGGKRTSCLENTRVQILQQLDAWLLDLTDFRIFWLNGMAGTGKSTIADSLYRAAESHGAHVAAFFCSRDLDTTRDILRIIPSLAYQLAVRYSAYRASLVTRLKSEDYPENFTLREQLENLILRPLASVSESSLSLVLFLIDALDECRGDGVRDHVRIFVDLLLSHADDFGKAGIKFFLSSRPSQEISHNFNLDKLRKHQRLVLHDADFVDVESDLELFVQDQLQETRKKHSSFTFSPASVTRISKASVPLFIFAATVCRYISAPRAGGSVNRIARLQLILSQVCTDKDDASTPSGKSNGGKADSAMEALHRLYETILRDAFMAEDPQEFDDEVEAKKAIFIIAAILLFFHPLSLSTMATLFGEDYSCEDTRKLLCDIHSAISVPDDDEQPVRALHASLFDYLTSRSRAPAAFHIDPPFYHGILAAECLELMQGILTYDNLCGLKVGEDQDIPDLQSRIQDSRVRDALPALWYACRYWSQHLATSTSTPDPRLIKALGEFTLTSLFRWIEVLVIFGQFEHAAPTITLACSWLDGLDVRTSFLGAASLLSDLHRMVIQFHDTIVASPIQIYISAFPFLPRQSALYTTYRDIIEPSLRLLDVITGVVDSWSPILGTVSTPPNLFLGAVCISPNSRTVACLGCHWDRPEGKLFFWDSVAAGPTNVVENESFCNDVSIRFHRERRLLGVSRLPRPSTWCFDMDLERLEEVSLDLGPAEEALRELEDGDKDGTYEQFSKTLCLSSDGSRLAGLLGRRYLLTWVLKEGNERDEEALSGLAFIPERCLRLTPDLPLPDTDEYVGDAFELQWSSDSSIIAINADRKGFLCTLPRETHSNCSVSPIERGAGSSDCRAIVWAEGGGYLACFSDYTFTVYSVTKAPTGTCTAVKIWTKKPNVEIVCVAFSPDAQFIAVGHRDGLINIHAVANPASVSTIREFSRALSGFGYTPDGRHIIGAVSYPHVIFVLDTETCSQNQQIVQAPFRRLIAPQGRERVFCRALKHSPTEDTISVAFTSDRNPTRVSVWDAAQGHLIASFCVYDVLHPDDGFDMAYTNNGRELLVIVPNNAYLYNLDACRHPRASLGLELTLTLLPLANMEFVPSGLTVLSKSDFMIFLLQRPQPSSSNLDIALPMTGCIFDTRTGKLIRSQSGIAVSAHSNICTAWSAGGDILACDSGDKIELWAFRESPGVTTHPRFVALRSVVAEKDRRLLQLSFGRSGKDLLAYFSESRSQGLFICSWNVELGEVVRVVDLKAFGYFHILTPHAGSMLVCTHQGTFKAEELVGMGESGPLPIPYDSPYSRYQPDQYGGWVRDFRGRKVFRLPQSHREWTFDMSYGKLLASTPTITVGRMLIMHICTDPA